MNLLLPSSRCKSKLTMGNMWYGYRNMDSRDLNVPITNVLSTSVPYFFSLELLFPLEDGGSTLLQMASKDLPNYKCHIFPHHSLKVSDDGVTITAIIILDFVHRLESLRSQGFGKWLFLSSGERGELPLRRRQQSARSSSLGTEPICDIVACISD
jgi:hypothetical protein